jgi:hypothetical protein
MRLDVFSVEQLNGRQKAWKAGFKLSSGEEVPG